MSDPKTKDDGDTHFSWKGLAEQRQGDIDTLWSELEEAREEIADTHEQLKATVLAGRAWMLEQKKAQAERDKLKGELEEARADFDRSGQLTYAEWKRMKADRDKYKAALERLERELLQYADYFREVDMPSGQIESIVELAGIARQSLNPKEPKDDYEKRNTLGGVAHKFEVMASRIRAGESVESVLRDYGLSQQSPKPEGHDPKGE